MTSFQQDPPQHPDRLLAAMHIRHERPGDAAGIGAVLRASFPSTLEAEVVERLRADGDLALSLLAEADGHVVGHVAFSPVTAAQGESGGIGLGPVAVLASHRRRGIGARLIREGLAASGRAGFTWAVVLGDPAYYGRFGFQAAAAAGLSDEYGGGDAFQFRWLVDPEPPRSPHGCVRYASAFGLFS